MKTYIQPNLAGNAELRRLVDAATPVLEEAIGEPARRVVATWDLATDSSPQALQLRLSDPYAMATSTFLPGDLTPPEKSELRFIRLWGDLLQEATRRQIKKLEAYEIS